MDLNLQTIIRKHYNAGISNIVDGVVNRNVSTNELKGGHSFDKLQVSGKLLSEIEPPTLIGV